MYFSDSKIRRGVLFVKAPIIRPLFIVALLAVLTISLFPFQDSQAQQDEKPTIFTSVVPIRYFVRQVTPEDFEILSFVEPQDSPETYEPTPSQLRKLASTKLFFRIGMPFEKAWLPKIKNLYPKLQIIDLRQTIPASYPKLEHSHNPSAHANHSENHGHSVSRKHDSSKKDQHLHSSRSSSSRKTHHQSSEIDPHIWTSPRLSIHIVSGIETELKKVFPKKAQEIASKAEAFKERLRKFDKKLTEELSSLQQRSFLVYHPAWGYLAHDYNLRQVAIEQDGKEPTLRGLQKIIDLARQNKINKVFIQSAKPSRSAVALAKAVNGKIISVNPLSADYFKEIEKFKTALLPQP